MTGFQAAYCYGAYEGTLRKLLHLFKYSGIQTLARPLARYLALAVPRDQVIDLIVPMPLHWRRQWQRGFNQAELLAKALSRRIGVPVVQAVKRKRSTVPQAGLSHAQRRKNVTGAFAVSGAKRIEGRHVLLVDDVFTTGATLGACAAALKRAGASRVSVLTVARVDRRAGSVLKQSPSLPESS